LCDGWRKSRWTQALALVWILYAAVAVQQDVDILRTLSEPLETRVQYRAAARQADRAANRGRMISDQPYFYTYYTGTPSLSPPVASKSELLQFLRKYHVRHLLLPAQNLDSFFPGGIAALAPEIQRLADVDSFILLQGIDKQ